MNLALAFGPLCLSFKGSLDLANHRADPRGLTGSEIGFVRIAQEFKARGHAVDLYTRAEQSEWEGMPVRHWDEMPKREYDAVIAINEPDLLRGARAKLRVCSFWLNDVTFCQHGFEQHVDLFVSPSWSHRERALTDPEWRDVNVTPSTPRGTYTYEPDPSKWIAIGLGCDPKRYELGVQKVPGRVIYSSSPDRGLHLLLEAWPAIKRAVPHAHLRIFYRLEPWLRGFDNTPYFAPIEKLRHRALYIEEALRRMSDPEWGIDVVGSVSREQIEREMAEAEVVAYPCDPVNSYTEGWSCSTLEACAARACPVISDADALGTIYDSHCPVVPRGNWTEWRDTVIRALTDRDFREAWNDKAEEFAREHTWAHHVARLEAAIEQVAHRADTEPPKSETEFMNQTHFVGLP